MKKQKTLWNGTALLIVAVLVTMAFAPKSWQVWIYAEGIPRPSNICCDGSHELCQAPCTAKDTQRKRERDSSLYPTEPTVQRQL